MLLMLSLSGANMSYMKGILIDIHIEEIARSQTVKITNQVTFHHIFLLILVTEGQNYTTALPASPDN